MEDEIDIEDLIEEEQCVFTLTQAGYIKRTPVSEYAAQSKGGMGKKGITTREEDSVAEVFTASTHDYILFFTDTGKVYRKKGYQIPESGKAAKGTNIVNILQVEQGERIQAMIHTRSIEDDGRFLFMVTRKGTVKRLPANALKNLRNNGIRALRMEEGDELISVRETDGTRRSSSPPTTAWLSALTRTTCAPWAGTPWASGASASGRATMWWAPPGPGPARPSSPSRRTATASARRWRSTASPTGAASASRTTAVTEKTGPVVGIKVVDGTEDLLLVTQAGILIRTPVENIRVAGRATQGVIVMRFKEEGDQVISMALAEHEDQTADGDAGDAPAETAPEA